MLFVKHEKRDGTGSEEFQRTYADVPRIGDWVQLPVISCEWDESLGSDTAKIESVIWCDDFEDHCAELFCVRVFEQL